MEDEGLKIGQVVELTGLSTPTLRHYDNVGLITPSGRSPGGFRLYSPADVRRILLVRRMKPLGFSLEQMREFLEAAEIMQAVDGGAGGRPTPQEQEQAEVILAGVRAEARSRYEKLRKQLSYAEEFLELATDLAP